MGIKYASVDCDELPVWLACFMLGLTVSLIYYTNNLYGHIYGTLNMTGIPTGVCFISRRTTLYYLNTLEDVGNGNQNLSYHIYRNVACKMYIGFGRRRNDFI